jgi:hypothetical protein
LPNISFDGVNISEASGQVLDGVNCTRCTIDVNVLSYSGGMFKCEQCTVKVERIELRGAALNTFNLLKALGLLGENAAAPPPKKPVPYIDPNAPRIMIASERTSPPTLTLVSLEK